MEESENDATDTVAVTACSVGSATPSLDSLPEHLILHILSFLPTQDTISTSLVSKKLRSYWSLIPSLNLSYSRFPPYNTPSTTRQFFAEFVDRTLISRSLSPLLKFCLDFIYEDRYGFHVDSWIRYAIKNQVQELDLDFFIDSRFFVDEPHLRDTYDFPFSALRHGKVRVLKLTRCDLTLPVNMSCMRLWTMKSVYLDQIYLSDQMVADLINGCPNLEVLELANCYGMDTLKVCSGKLKELVLEYFIRSDTEANLEIDCPNLVSLTIIWFEVGKCRVQNLSSLVRFHTSIGHKRDLYYGYWKKIVSILDQVPHIKSLLVQNWWLKLELLTGYTQYDLLGMAQLLELTPHMETLILDYLLKVDKDESLSEELLKKPINLSIPSLKEVKMKQFTCTEKEDSLWRALEIHFDCSLPRHSQFIHFFSTLRSIHFGSQVSIIWRVAVVTCIWEIWHCRNEAIFKDVSPSIQHSKINLFRMIRESFASSKGFCSSRRDAVILSCLLASPRPPLAPNIIPVHWLKPPPGWIKVNVDGSAFGTPGEAGAGGIFRNYRGFPNGCFAFSTPLSFAYMAELRAAIFAIELAWETNWHQLWVESDSIYVVNLLRHRSIDVPWSIRQEWLHCLSICSRMNILVSHIFREGNRVADALVKVWSLFFSNQLVAFRSYFFATGLSMMTFVIFLNCVFLDFSEPFSSPSFVCSPPSHLVQTLTFFFY
ncbi:F-box/LRR-repeat protein At4g14096-like isoform X2 [Euphorbia lathyris]|uniref:F-box/LRR-repeat protein At4g14096-like isoform X2 n=1 Tax=Euphorbia lathyris TaxID=212925 RepID=UPI00331387C3